MATSRLRFALKAAQGLRILRHIVRQELERDKPTKINVLRFVNDTHPAATELLHNVVVRDGLADHWAEILEPVVGQVNEGKRLPTQMQGLHYQE